MKIAEQLWVVVLVLALYALPAAVAIFLALGVYGFLIIVFKGAYGIALPNPGPWMQQHWPWAQTP